MEAKGVRSPGGTGSRVRPRFIVVLAAAALLRLGADLPVTVLALSAGSHARLYLQRNYNIPAALSERTPHRLRRHAGRIGVLSPANTSADAGRVSVNAVYGPYAEPCEECAPGVKPQPDSSGLVSTRVLVAVSDTNADTDADTDVGSRVRVAGGVAYRSQFPWQSALFVDDRYLCEGSLISDSWVLTSARCVHGLEKVELKLGVHFLLLPSEKHRMRVQSSDIRIHPHFDRLKCTNDIAVVKLAESVGLNRYVNSVRLPTLSSFTTSYEGRFATLSGWGLQSQNGKLSTMLGFVVVPVISNRECAESFGSNIHSAHLCTSSENFKGGCNADSGAPLVVMGEHEGARVFTQIGIFSFISRQGCVSGEPAGYTRLTAHLRWIENTTGIAPTP